MARPQKQTVDYFPHRCKPGKTMFILETRYGDKGYTFWFKTLELLGSTSGHAYYFEKEDNCEYIQAYTRTTKEQAIEILDLLANLGAIEKNLWIKNHIIWSDNFTDGIRDAYRNRTIDIPDKPVSDVRNTASISVSDVKNPHTKLNNTKLNNTKLPEFIDRDVFLTYIKSRKKPSEQAIVLLVKKLEEFHAAGDDPNEVLKRSIMNGWTGIFPLDKKGGQSGTHRGSPRQIRPRESYTRPEDF